MKQLKNIPEFRDIPFFMISGIAEDSEVKKMKEDGLREYLHKPLDRGEITRSLFLADIMPN